MYKDATLFFSQDTVVTIAHVIPTMDRIDSMLSNSVAEPLVPSVKHALMFTHKIMDKYYPKTDLSNIYWIAMGTTNRIPVSCIITNYLRSSSSSTKTQVLSAAWVATGLGLHCRNYSQGGVHQILCAQGDSAD